MSNPFPIFYEGTAAPLAELYRYTVSTLFTIQQYRIQIRTALNYDLELEVYNGSTLVDTISVDVLVQDSGVITISPIQFNAGDVFILKVASGGTAQTSNGFDFTFFVDLADVPDASLASQRIQTPLLARVNGAASGAPNPFYSYTFSQLTEVTGFTLTSRVAPAGTLTVQVLRGVEVVATLSTTAQKATFSAGIYFQTSETLHLRVSAAVSASSLSVLIDYKNTTQTTFTDWQTPFSGYYQGLASDSNQVAFSYTLPRNITLAYLQGVLTATQASIVQFGFYVNSTLRRTSTIAIGSRVSTVLQLDMNLVATDVIEIRLLSPSVITTDLIVTLDYYLQSVDEQIVYYSDPIADIVLQARQVGIGAGKSDGLGLGDLPKYQKDVDNILNARLSPLYRTPLYRLTTERSYGSPWPNPIQVIAQRLVMERVLNDSYSEVEPNASASVAASAALAAEDLNSVLKKEYVLDGQRFRSRNSGSNPYTEPLMPLTSPVPMIPGV